MTLKLQLLPLTVDLLEHPEHVLQVAVVQEPNGGVLVILLKGNCAENTTVAVTYAASMQPAYIYKLQAGSGMQAAPAGP